MEDNNNILRNNFSSRGLRLAARITGTIWVLFCLVGFIGYFIEGIQRNGFRMPTDALAFATVIFLLAGLAGLVVAFWRTGTGVIISVSGFVLSAISLICDPKLHFSPVFFIIFLPSFLYYAYWRETKR
jgi:hypothetical protein